jgi:Holliday junction DNA helicase RuvA
MIAFIRGSVFSIGDDFLVIDIGGTGILTYAPLNMLAPPPTEGKEIFLHTHTHIREDSWQLFGFPLMGQLKLFRLLLGISGIGAKTALAVLNTLNADNIVSAAAAGDYGLFCAVPGVGKKTAQRLILELKDKAPLFGGALSTEYSVEGSHSDSRELLTALTQLGFPPTEARLLAKKALDKLGAGANINALLKEALRSAEK